MTSGIAARGGAERRRTLVKRLDVEGGKYGHDRAHHEWHGEDDMADENEEPGGGNRQAAIGKQQGQCNRESRIASGSVMISSTIREKAPSPDVQRIGRDPATSVTANVANATTKDNRIVPA
jgi:hypothetical protein